MQAARSSAGLRPSSGSTTFYEASGQVISRATTSGNTTTVYDAGGRNVGREPPKRRSLRSATARHGHVGAPRGHYGIGKMAALACVAESLDLVEAAPGTSAPARLVLISLHYAVGREITTYGILRTTYRHSPPNSCCQGMK
jgi:YD repeat-containing protein